jgi:uroporphyrinogen III methyltransferase / synthase
LGCCTNPSGVLSRDQNLLSLPLSSRGGEGIATAASEHRSAPEARSQAVVSVSLVGAGPGDAGLFTVRGAELLGRAEVVIYDGLVNRELLRYAPPIAEIIYGGKHDRTRCVSQAELNALLLTKALEGKRVVRLKGGDPFIFGRGGEEAELLANAGIPFEVVPGVSSVHSVPACAGIPLTHRRYASAVTIVTGHDAPSPEVGRGVPTAPGEVAEVHSIRASENNSGAVGTPRPPNPVDWPGVARMPGTLVVLMGLKNIQEIAETLIAHARRPETPVAVVSRGTTGRQQTLVGTLATIAELARRTGMTPPAVTVIGSVVNLREQLNWFERRPLFSRRVVVTQRSDLARPLVTALRERGAEVLEVPATRWVPHPDGAAMERALANLDCYDWILFTNPQGVDFFFERLLEVHHDLRRLGPAKLGAYGPRTGQRLREWHLRPEAVAADHKTPLILEALAKCGSVRGQRFLVLRGDVAHEKVPEALETLGAEVDVVSCYAVVPETADPTGAADDLAQKGADWIVFASGLAIEHLHERFDLPHLVARFPNTRLAIASDTIRWALEKLGLAPATVSQPNDVEDLVNAIVSAELGANERHAASHEPAHLFTPPFQPAPSTEAESCSATAPVCGPG